VVFCNAPDDNPFMAGAFHGVTEADAIINVGVSGPGVVKTALEQVRGENFEVLCETIKKTAFKITRVGQLVAKEASQMLGIPFGIVDLSLAPTPAIGDSVADILKEIYATYPRCVCDALMNLLGTHDTERILTVLGEGNDRNFEESNEILSTKRLTEIQYQKGIALLKMAATIQYTVYGVPSVFYGDEAGLQGYHDPFCRRTYPWGREDRELLAFYQKLGEIRTSHSAFEAGDFAIDVAENGFLVYTRWNEKEKITVLVNRDSVEHAFDLNGVDLLSDSVYSGVILPNTVQVILHSTAKEKKL